MQQTINLDEAFLELSSEEQEIVKTLCSFSPVKFAGEDKKILPVKKWLQSSYHVGSVSETLYPYWHKHLDEVFNNKGINVSELIITGSLSTGKTFFSLVVWLRLLYLLSNEKNPQKLLGLDPTSRVFLAFLSVSLTEAELTGFGDFRNLVDSIPYFAERYPRNKNKNRVLEFPNGVSIVGGSEVLHFIGSNLLSLLFDEANFVRRGGGIAGDVKKAWEIYIAARLRTLTRFSVKNSPAISPLNILVSSSTHQTSFTEQLIKSSGDSKNTKVVVSRLFEAKPKGTFSNKKFLFFMGNDLVGPCVIKSKEDINNRIIMKKEDVNHLPEITMPLNKSFVLNSFPSDVRGLFVEVPDNFREECERFPDRAVMDIIGASSAATNLFFKSKIDFNACVAAGESMGLKHPFTKEEISIGLRDQIRIIDYLDRERLLRFALTKDCYIHIDQSISGCPTGIAMCTPYELESGEFVVLVLFMLRVNPPGGNDQISISKCREFVEDLMGLGITIKSASFDSFQSSDSIQILTTKGINAVHFSADKSDEPWLKVSDLFFLRKIRLYEYEPFRSEWFSLIHDRVARKINHPDKGMKDVSDSLVASAVAAYRSIENKDSSVEIANRMVGMLGRFNTRTDSKEEIVDRLFGMKLHESMRYKMGVFERR